MLKLKLGRNDKCYCGSGKKYKKCCLQKDSAFIPEEVLNNLLNKMDAKEKHLNIVPSVVYKEHRLRVIWNKVYPRPLKETFHEFLLYILKATFGQEWYEQQMRIEEKERHVLVKWVYSNYRFSKKTIRSGNKIIDQYGNVKWGGVPTGDAQALMQLAYDIYCLQIVNKLPEFIIKKLKDIKAFQSVRYEIAVAAIMVRAGFSIDFLDGKIKADKHCEFIATHKYSNISIGIEAKSRRRGGVLNEKGDLNADKEARRGVWHLFTKARKQKPEGIPYIIFIDLNVRPTPEIPIDKKPWYKDIINMVEHYGKPTEKSPDPYNALILTNFSYYYSGEQDTPKGEYLFVLSQYPEIKIENTKVLDSIFDSVNRYNKISDEL